MYACAPDLDRLIFAFDGTCHIRSKDQPPSIERVVDCATYSLCGRGFCNCDAVSCQGQSSVDRPERKATFDLRIRDLEASGSSTFGNTFLTLR
jgi:hypothetical protein